MMKDSEQAMQNCEEKNKYLVHKKLVLNGD